MRLLLGLLLASGLMAYEMPKSAFDFVDSVGINTHFSYDTSIYYTNYALVKQALSDLGIKHIRDGVHANGQPANLFTYLNGLSSLGITGDYVVNPTYVTSDEIAAFHTAVHNMTSMENANEPDYEIGGTWQSVLTTSIPFMRSQANTYGVTLLGPSLVYCPASYNSLGDITTNIDATNIHPYPSGSIPELSNGPLPAFMACAATSSSTKPIWASENGYYDSLTIGGGVDEATHATYLPRLLLHSWNVGIKKTFIYELADEDSTSVAAGMMDSSGTRRAQFGALANLLNLLADSATFTTTGLNYIMTGNTDGIYHTLLQKQDGTYWLALWQPASVWDVAGHSTISVSGKSVKLAWVGTPRGYRTYGFNTDGTVTDSGLQTGQSVTLSIGPAITLVKMGQAGQTATNGVTTHTLRQLGTTSVF